MKRRLIVLPVGLELVIPDVDKVVAAAELLHAAVPMDRVVFTRAVIGPPLEFGYNIFAVDGRNWHQHLTFDVMPNPKMNFVVNDLWRLTEFAAQRSLRNILVSFVGVYPSLEQVKYLYLETGA